MNYLFNFVLKLAGMPIR